MKIPKIDEDRKFFWIQLTLTMLGMIIVLISYKNLILLELGVLVVKNPKYIELALMILMGSGFAIIGHTCDLWLKKLREKNAGK